MSQLKAQPNSKSAAFQFGYRPKIRKPNFGRGLRMGRFVLVTSAAKPIEETRMKNGLWMLGKKALAQGAIEQAILAKKTASDDS